ncbi:MAG: hypothetical protein FWD61_02710 [Phycisphaerales bacterium]|nr:hypothetical protein [Phycisphaerales bacterium]
MKTRTTFLLVAAVLLMQLSSCQDASSTKQKLGNTEVSRNAIDAYQNEKDPDKKAELAKRLGRIGDAACVATLAADMRTPVIYLKGGGLQSLRIDIIEALSEVYPNVSVLRRRDVHGFEEIDQWYDEVEKWLVRRFGTQWNTPRPKPFAWLPIPTSKPGDRPIDLTDILTPP